jgi:hypothetical protein
MIRMKSVKRLNLTETQRKDFLALSQTHNRQLTAGLDPRGRHIDADRVRGDHGATERVAVRDPDRRLRDVQHFNDGRLATVRVPGREEASLLLTSPSSHGQRGHSSAWCRCPRRVCDLHVHMKPAPGLPPATA